MRAAAVETDLTSLAASGAAQGARALAGLVGGEPWAGALFEPDPGQLGAYETGVAFEIGGALAGEVVVLFTGRVRERLLGALGGRARADAASALREVANIVASQAVSAIADRLGASVTLSIPRLAEPGSGRALARALRSGGRALASELGAGGVGPCALLVLLSGGPASSAIP
jgi:hypothetical protein